MEYQDTDEITRREAIEKVKQIVKAIKAIRIKYYPDFSKVSEKDQETEQKLQANLEQIAQNNGLNELRSSLIQEVDERYGGKEPENKNDSILQACYGAIDAQKEAISKGKITQALRCQEQLKMYKQKLSKAECQEIINYKREKFAELMQTREQLEENMKKWNSQLKGMYKIEHAQKRREAMEVIQNLQNPEKSQEKQTEIEENAELVNEI